MYRFLDVNVPFDDNNLLININTFKHLNNINKLTSICLLKCNSVSVYARKAYRGNGGIAQPIFNFSAT